MGQFSKYSSPNHLRWCKSSTTQILLGFSVFIYCITVISCAAINHEQNQGTVIRPKKASPLMMSAIKPLKQIHMKQQAGSGSANRNIGHGYFIETRPMHPSLRERQLIPGFMVSRADRQRPGQGATDPIDCENPQLCSSSPIRRRLNTFFLGVRRVAQNMMKPIEDLFTFPRLIVNQLQG
ncbi:uncharacterized protein LOC141855678 [Brevipalpus obovatus]|uniref:uncharacterized protein LOC141855678 n=1 Tax=Brevipalpus obovatus TaxID=246614 RepID=UPI003D9F5669